MGNFSIIVELGAIALIIPLSVFLLRRLPAPESQAVGIALIAVAVVTIAFFTVVF